MNSPAPALQPIQEPRRRFVAPRVIIALVLREMATRYGRSPGGYIWAFLEPLGGIIILSYAFALLLRTPSLGSSFLLFFASAYLPLQMYSATSGAVQKALTFSKALLKYPIVSWFDAIVARFLLNGLTAAFVTFVLLTGIIAVTDTNSVLDFGPMLTASGLALLLGLGDGILNCVLTGFFPIWRAFWSIVTRPLVLASGIFYIYEDLPDFAQAVLWYNPLIHITGHMRSGVFTTYNPQYVNLTYVAVFGLVLVALGMVFMHRFHRELMNR